MPETLSPTDDPEIKPLPDAVKQALEGVGVNGDAVYHLQTDIDAHGQFGERFLVATPQKLVVVANNGSAHIEREVPLSDIGAIESRGLSGITSLEARLKTLEGDKVVELIRGSNGRAREMSQAAEKITQLRNEGVITESRTKEKSVNCPKCGRPFSRDSHVCAFCNDRISTLKRLYTYMVPYKWLALASALLNLFTIAMGFVPIILTKKLVDEVFPLAIQKNSAAAVAANANGESTRTLIIMVALILGAAALTAGAAIIRGRLASYLGAAVLHDIRSQLYSHLQRLSVSYYDKREVGAVMSRVQNDVGAIQNFLLDTAEETIISVLTIIGVVTIMLYYSPLLALLTLIPVPFVIMATFKYWSGLMRLWRRVWHQNSALGARLADALGGVRVVRAFGAEDREVGNFINRSGSLRDATMNVEIKAANFYPAIGFVMGLGLPLTWLFGGLQVLNGSIEFGTIILFTGLLGQLNGPVTRLTRQTSAITRSTTAAERVFEVMDTEPEIQEIESPIALPKMGGHVEFKNVSFGYERERPVLRNVDLDIKPGEMIGLVGHSGAGKSTLINLLLRFYDVTEGALLIDGVDIRDIKRDDLRRQVGVVLQESYLFHGTIYDNIAYGNPGATAAEVIAAARAAHAHHYIIGFPDGYDTLVGERGTRLSGGERQRIAIARAILHNPKILILDEATASVDTQTEAAIQGALQNLTKGRTTFAIAHRLSTLKNADRLVVIEGGQVVEVGTHDELLKKRGAFYRLVQAQQQMNQIVTVGG